MAADLSVSPTPWRVHLVDETLIVDANGNEVCRMCGDYDADYARMARDAALIVEAVNRLAARQANSTFLAA